MSVARWAVTCALLAAAVGCQPELPRASLISHMRVLGATTSVPGDPTRATPKPGEKADVTWSVVYPDPNMGDDQLASLFLVCTAPATYTGIPPCQELIDIARGGDLSAIAGAVTNGAKPPDCNATPDSSMVYGPFQVVCVTNTPELRISVPQDAKGARLVEGIICRNGTPKLDQNAPGGFVCDPHRDVKASERESLMVYGTVPVELQDSQVNHNPDIGAAVFKLHDPPLPWDAISDDEAANLNDDNCLDEASAGRVMHSDGHQELITIDYGGADQQSDPRELHNGQPETLEFSAYTTFGKLERRFTIFDSSDKLPLSDSFHWDLTADQRAALNGKSKRVRFWFTVIDQRGGYAQTARDLCIDRQ